MRRHKHRTILPGEILRMEYLEPYGITQRALADHIDVDIKVINRIVNGRSAVSPVVSIKLAYAFGTTVDYWIRAQLSVDLEAAERLIDRYPEPLI